MGPENTNKSPIKTVGSALNDFAQDVYNEAHSRLSPDEYGELLVQLSDKFHNELLNTEMQNNEAYKTATHRRNEFIEKINIMNNCVLKISKEIDNQ